MEKKSSVSTKYLFPNYEVLHWFAARHLLHTLHGDVIASQQDVVTAPVAVQLYMD